MTMGKGSNDARRVVWALGESFIFPSYFLILIYVLLHSTFYFLLNCHIQPTNFIFSIQICCVVT